MRMASAACNGKYDSFLLGEEHRPYVNKQGQVCGHEEMQIILTRDGLFRYTCALDSMQPPCTTGDSSLQALQAPAEEPVRQQVEARMEQTAGRSEVQPCQTPDRGLRAGSETSKGGAGRAQE